MWRAIDSIRKNLEATPGIEPGYTDLQSAASPLRHVALVVSAVRLSALFAVVHGRDVGRI